MKRMMSSVLLALPLIAPAAHAQDRGPLVVPAGFSSEAMLLRLSASSRCRQGCFVRGLPYTAERVSESVRVLADGNRIVQRSSEQLYRDGDGRSRVDSVWVGRALVQIQDPVQNMSYRLYPREQMGIKMSMGSPSPVAGTAPAGMMPVGKDGFAGAAKVAEQLAPALAAAASSDSVQTTRALGTRQMEGLAVEGTLVTSTIAAGKAGNTLPIVSTVETWHAHDLDLDVYVKTIDPRDGERVTRLQNVRRAEPPAAVFAIPDGYTVQELARK